MGQQGRRMRRALLFVLALACVLQGSSAAQHRGALEAAISDGGGEPPQSIVKAVPEGAARPFLALKDPATAAGQDVQRLYEQGASASAIAYLLFAAAEPLSEAEGSSPVLLPYLSPTTLRLYASRSERCSSDLVRSMYELSNSLYGSTSLKACHFALYRSLQSTFAWVRDNIALTLQQLPDQPLAAAAWPDSALYPDPELAAAVQAAALSDADSLAGAAAAMVEGSCGMSTAELAGLVPRIAGVLAGLHADLGMLQEVVSALHDAHWAASAAAAVDPWELGVTGGAGSGSLDSDGGEDAPSVTDIESSDGSSNSGSSSSSSSDGVGTSMTAAWITEGAVAAATASAASSSSPATAAAIASTSDKHRRRSALEVWRTRVRGGARKRTPPPGQLTSETTPLASLSQPLAPFNSAPSSPEGGGTAAGNSGLSSTAGEQAEATDEQQQQQRQEQTQQQQEAAHEDNVLARSRNLGSSTTAIPSNFYYSMPPDNFASAPPASLPQLLVPLIFHIMLYKDGAGSNSTAPAKYGQAGAYVERMVRVVNYMAKPANVQFFVKEVRANAGAHPYLLLPDRSSWLSCPNGGASGAACLNNATLVSSMVADFPRSVNVFVASDSTAASVPLGYAWVPGSDVFPEEGYVFMTWDGLSTDGSNSRAAYEDGPNTLLHETFHHLGVKHTFNPSNSGLNGCNFDDYVVDTPTTYGAASSSRFAATATAYCMELFWGTYSGDWDAAYTRWSSNLGVPETDMNAWADTCPTRAGYDELGNYMTYNTPVCFAALGHFTEAQVERIHFVSYELNPVLYTWAQYYAQNAAPAPPPGVSPPPEYFNQICTATKNNCACKSSWTFNNTAYSYCDRTGSTNSLTCEVGGPAACADCATANTTATEGKCILSCAGTARQCKRSLAPGTNNPPPPPPRPPSPPPMPPPPPPVLTPSACMKSQSGCDCRSTWIYDAYFASYCASPDGSSQLWCQVTPSCPSFNVLYPYDKCSKNLTLSYCGVSRVRFRTSMMLPANPVWPPPSPSPPPMPPPSPPPPAPTSVAVAKSTAALSLAANCSSLRPDASAALADLVTELAAVLSVPTYFINVSSLACSPSAPTLLLADYTVYFPPGATPVQIGNTTLLLASTPSMKAAVSARFQERWGDVSQATYNTTTILQRLALVGDGPYFLQQLENRTAGLAQVLLPDGGIGLFCNNLGAAEAATLCRQLGFNSGVPYSLPAVPSSSDASYKSSLFLSGLSCGDAAASDAASFQECASRGWAQAGAACNLTTVAGVLCSGGLAAALDAAVVLRVSDCSAAASVGSGLLLSELWQELAGSVYAVSSDRLVVRGKVECVAAAAGGGYLLQVPYSLQFPNGSKATQVEAAQKLTSAEQLAALLSARFQARWGPVAGAELGEVALIAREELCAAPEDAATGVCGHTSHLLTTAQLIGLVAGTVGGVTLLAVLLTLLYSRYKRRSGSGSALVVPSPPVVQVRPGAAAVAAAAAAGTNGDFVRVQHAGTAGPATTVVPTAGAGGIGAGVGGRVGVSMGGDAVIGSGSGVGQQQQLQQQPGQAAFARRSGSGGPISEERVEGSSAEPLTAPLPSTSPVNSPRYQRQQQQQQGQEQQGLQPQQQQPEVQTSIRALSAQLTNSSNNDDSSRGGLLQRPTDNGNPIGGGDGGGAQASTTSTPRPGSGGRYVASGSGGTMATTPRDDTQSPTVADAAAASSSSPFAAGSAALGVTVLQQLQQQQHNSPISLRSASASTEAELEGVTPPLRIRELSARSPAPRTTHGSSGSARSSRQSRHASRTGTPDAAAIAYDGSGGPYALQILQQQQQQQSPLSQPRQATQPGSPEANTASPPLLPLPPQQQLLLQQQHWSLPGSTADGSGLVGTATPSSRNTMHANATTHAAEVGDDVDDDDGGVDELRIPSYVAVAVQRPPSALLPMSRRTSGIEPVARRTSGGTGSLFAVQPSVQRDQLQPQQQQQQLLQQQETIPEGEETGDEAEMSDGLVVAAVGRDAVSGRNAGSSPVAAMSLLLPPGPGDLGGLTSVGSAAELEGVTPVRPTSGRTGGGGGGADSDVNRRLSATLTSSPPSPVLHPIASMSPRASSSYDQGNGSDGASAAAVGGLFANGGISNADDGVTDGGAVGAAIGDIHGGGNEDDEDNAVLPLELTEAMSPPRVLRGGHSGGDGSSSSQGSQGRAAFAAFAEQGSLMAMHSVYEVESEGMPPVDVSGPGAIAGGAIAAGGAAAAVQPDSTAATAAAIVAPATVAATTAAAAAAAAFCGVQEQDLQAAVGNEVQQPRQQRPSEGPSAAPAATSSAIRHEPSLTASEW